MGGRGEKGIAEREVSAGGIGRRDPNSSVAIIRVHVLDHEQAGVVNRHAVEIKNLDGEQHPVVSGLQIRRCDFGNGGDGSRAGGSPTAVWPRMGMIARVCIGLDDVPRVHGLGTERGAVEHG